MNVPIKSFRPLGLAGKYLPDDLVIKLPADDRGWVRRPSGHLYFPLLFDLSNGVTVNVLRYPKGGIIGRHVHDGPVYSYTMRGSWGYVEHDWVADAGTFIWEPPGEMHTLEMYEADTMAFYVMHGGLTSLDDDDRPTRVDNVLTLLAACDEYYQANGFGKDYVKQFIR